MSVSLTVHRGVQEIGGSCIELATDRDERLVLDVGRPLTAAPDETGLLPSSLDTSSHATVLFSHSHLDHWGLARELPSTWPLFASPVSAALINLTANISRSPHPNSVLSWDSAGFDIGPFRVQPYLTDHSAFDAHMLLIEVHGRRILYTGDFRMHGRKSVLVDRVVSTPPKDIDVLIMEGTNLGTDKPTKRESELEDDFVELSRDTKGQVYVYWSAQNIDRTVSLYRAAKRTGRKIVVDLYTADVLARAASEGARIPKAGGEFNALRVVITPKMKWLYERLGRQSFVEEIVQSGSGVSRSWVARERCIVMTRESLLDDFEKDSLGFTPDDCFVFSSWSGYLDANDENSCWARATRGGSHTVMLHTSGHASSDALKRFASAISPKVMVPVHGSSWEDHSYEFSNVLKLANGEKFRIP